MYDDEYFFVQFYYLKIISAIYMPRKQGDLSLAGDRNHSDKNLNFAWQLTLRKKSRFGK